MTNPIAVGMLPDYTLSAEYRILDALDDEALIAHPDCGKTTAELVLMERLGRALDALDALE
jgi:hypothetical protein